MEKEYQFEQADQLLSYSNRKEDGTWDSGVIGNIVFPENRNPRPDGTPYVKGKMALNINKINELIKEGKVKISKTGWAYLEVNPPLTDEQKTKFASQRKSTTPAKDKPAEEPKVKRWGSESKSTETKPTASKWGSKSTTPSKPSEIPF